MMLLPLETRTGLRITGLYTMLLLYNHYSCISAFIYRPGQIPIHYSRHPCLHEQLIGCAKILSKIFLASSNRGEESVTTQTHMNLSKIQSLRIVNDFCHPAVKGNCRGLRPDEKIAEKYLEPLPRRKYKHK